MSFLYSLYDALVSIAVPPEKARAVVDAMERDMTTSLATKQDLEAKYTLLRHEIDTSRALLAKDIEALQLTMTIRLGSMLMLGPGLLFAALKLS